MRAYVLVCARPGMTKEVLKKAKAIEGVVQGEMCWGRPDVFLLVDTADLAGVVMDSIQAISGVESTETHVIIEK